MRYRVHIVAFLGLAVATAEAHTQLYNVIDLGDLGGLSSSAAGINAAGVATGSVATFDAAANAYYPTAVAFNGHSITDVGTLPLGAINFSYGTAINIWGQIVGSSTGLSDGATVQHAFLSTPGKGMSDLGALLDPALTTVATGINFWGHVVGYAFDGTSYSSWLYNGSVRTLASAQQLGASQAVAINDTGRVLVHLFPSQGGSLCDVWIDGVMVKLPVTPACVPAAISNAGYVTGDLYPGNYAHAFSYKLGAAMPTDLGTLASGNASARLMATALMTRV